MRVRFRVRTGLSPHRCQVSGHTGGAPVQHMHAMLFGPGQQGLNVLCGFGVGHAIGDPTDLAESQAQPIPGGLAKSWRSGGPRRWCRSGDGLPGAGLARHLGQGLIPTGIAGGRGVPDGFLQKDRASGLSASVLWVSPQPFQRRMMAVLSLCSSVRASCRFQSADD